MEKFTPELSGKYCPFCMTELRRSKGSGLLYCPDDPECGYEEGEGSKAPLSLRDRQQWDLNRKRAHIEHHMKALTSLREECTELERLLGVGSD